MTPTHDRSLHLRPSAVAMVFAGGAIGTAARYGLAQAIPAGDRQWPWGTFTANVLGALLLGALLEGLSLGGTDAGARRWARLVVGVGFCGGLTTYSTFAVEGDLLVHHDAVGLAAGYVLATLTAGLAAVLIGVSGARVVVRPATDGPAQ